MKCNLLHHCFSFFSFPGLDAQIWYVRDHILGRITLPDAEARLKDAAEWQAREAKVNGFADSVEYIIGYVADLLAPTDYPRIDLKGAAYKLECCMRDKAEDILHYRDKAHASHITGTVAAIKQIPWFESKEDGKYIK